MSSENNISTANNPAWANPTPAGLVALAAACACFFALLTGKVTNDAMPLIGCWLLGGFVVQITVALLDLKSGNLAGGNTFLFFCAFFMLASGLEMFAKHNALTAGLPADGRVDGYVWGALTLVTWLWTPAFWKKFTLLSVIIALLDVALPLIAIADLKVFAPEVSANMGKVAAWFLAGSGLVAIYTSAAMVVNGTFGKKIYPMP
ncbi:MAG: hypothetical protein FWD16_04865 [Clostridia bacterium]|nr:hypothetical protein [Clostridia bacterium]